MHIQTWQLKAVTSEKRTEVKSKLRKHSESTPSGQRARTIPEINMRIQLDGLKPSSSIYSDGLRGFDIAARLVSAGAS